MASAMQSENPVYRLFFDEEAGVYSGKSKGYGAIYDSPELAQADVIEAALSARRTFDVPLGDLARLALAENGEGSAVVKKAFSEFSPRLQTWVRNEANRVGIV